MPIGKAYHCSCGKKYLIFIPTIKQIKMQDPKTIKDVDVSLRIGYKKELDFAKNYTKRRGLILVDGTNLEAFQCSCGRPVDVDLEMQKKIDEEMKRVMSVVSKAPEEKGRVEMKSNPLVNQKFHKFTKAQKIVMIATITLILLSEAVVLGVRYYYREDTVRLSNLKLAQVLIDAGEKEKAVIFYKVMAGGRGQLIRKMENSNLDYLQDITAGVRMKTIERIRIRNRRILIMHFVSLSFLILGGATFLIAKLNKND